MGWQKKEKIEWGIFAPSCCCRRWSLDRAGLGWAVFSFLLDRRHGRMYACLVYTCALVTSHELINERTNACMDSRPPHHPLGEPLAAVCCEPLARSGGGGDMCGLPKVESSVILLSLDLFLRKGGLSSEAYTCCLLLVLTGSYTFPLVILSPPHPLLPRLFGQCLGWMTRR